MSIPTISARPSRSSPATFATEADLAWTELITTIDGINTALINIDEAVATVSSGMGASTWVAGTYAVGDRRYSPTDAKLYRSKTAHTGSTDPRLDQTNWSPMAYDAPPLTIETGTSRTMGVSTMVVYTNTAQVTVTLPASPIAGNWLYIKFANGRVDNIINPNGLKYEGQTDSVYIDSINEGITLRYISSTYGWGEF